MIQLEDLTLQYPGGRPAIRNLTCRFGRPGGRLALLGANGAGKSTLMLGLTALILPASGTVRIDSLLLEKKHISAIRRKIGLVFQNPDDQLFCSTVAEDVAFGPRNLCLPEAEVADRVDRALDAMHISHLRERFPQQLSAGEKRRAAIAGVLAMNPEIILFDEPTSGLDPRGQRELATLLQSLRQFCMIATHDLTFARGVCSEAMILQNGTLRELGPIESAFADRGMLEECGLV